MKKKQANKKQTKGNSSAIAYQNKDIVSKVMAEEFKGKTFAVYGIDVPKVKRADPTNLPMIAANELRLDNLFELVDGSYAIVDYESKYSPENMIKYIGYVARIIFGLHNEICFCYITDKVINKNRPAGGHIDYGDTGHSCPEGRSCHSHTL